MGVAGYLVVLYGKNKAGAAYCWQFGRDHVDGCTNLDNTLQIGA